MDVTAPYRILNFPNSVSIAASKLATFRKLTEAGIPTVKWTTSRDEATAWFTSPSSSIVFARHYDGASGGQGIEIIGCIEHLARVNAPLYTLYQLPKRELRVHVFLGEVIDYTQKLFRNGEDIANRLVRSHDNGAFFSHGCLPPCTPTIEACKLAIDALGLDFGAIDVIETDRGPLILEVNSAPGLDANGQTAARYITKLNKVLENSYLGLDIL